MDADEQWYWYQVVPGTRNTLQDYIPISPIYVMHTEALASVNLVINAKVRKSLSLTVGHMPQPQFHACSTTFGKDQYMYIAVDVQTYGTHTCVVLQWQPV
jgi:hypothetical protein